VAISVICSALQIGSSHTSRKELSNSTERIHKNTAERYIRCRLRKKLRLLGDDLRSIGIPIDNVVAAIIAAVALPTI
jgi:hypothetical protein